MTLDTPRPDWRQNPNLVECFDDCVAMFRTVAASPSRGPSLGEVMRQRREALGLSKVALGMAAGFRYGTACSVVAKLETFLAAPVTRKRVDDALDRLEANRATDGAAGLSAPRRTPMNPEESIR